MLYLKLDNRIEATVVETQEDLDEKLAGGWVKNPALLGFLTAPSFEQLKEMSKPKVEKAETKTLTLNKK
jgi:hypothetical protein